MFADHVFSNTFFLLRSLLYIISAHNTDSVRNA